MQRQDRVLSQNSSEVTNTSGTDNVNVSHNVDDEISERSGKCPIHQRSVLSPKPKERSVSERSDECAIHQISVLSPKPKERSVSERSDECAIHQRSVVSPKPKERSDGNDVSERSIKSPEQKSNYVLSPKVRSEDSTIHKLSPIKNPESPASPKNKSPEIPQSPKLQGVSIQTQNYLITQDRSTSIQLAEVIEKDTQTRQTETQTIETQTSVDVPPPPHLLHQQHPPTTVAVIETYHQQHQHKNNGAIPKHSRKKSLPEAAYLSREETTMTPYEILKSPPARMRPRSNTYKEVNSRPHSSISMVYTAPWTVDDDVRHPKLSEAAAKTERLFHTLERENYRIGRHHHPGHLESMNLVYESGDTITSVIDDSNENIDILECLTPAPYEFTDNASNDDLTISETPPHKHHRRQHSHHDYGKDRFLISKGIHPHSRSTETILFHSDKDPNPIVPNKKPGTPDIWLPRTIRA